MAAGVWLLVACYWFLVMCFRLVNLSVACAGKITYICYRFLNFSNKNLT